jgi:hypothetical protein
MQCLIHRRNNMASIIFAGLSLLCSALCLMAANEDAITRISKTNVFMIPSLPRFSVFGIYMYGWQSRLCGSIPY